LAAADNAWHSKAIRSRFGKTRTHPANGLLGWIEDRLLGASGRNMPMPNRTRSPQFSREHAGLPGPGGASDSAPDTAEDDDVDSVNREGDADIEAEEEFDDEQEAYEDSSFEDEEE
jgi:hypothetical protein